MIGPKVVVVGAGAFGKNHVRTFAQLNALRGVVDLNQEILDSVKADYPQAATYASVDQALADDQSSSFVVATPAPYHFDIAKQIILAKRHVLVEKPMTLQAEQSRELVMLAKQHDVQLMVGHLLLFQPFINWFHEFMASNDMGKVLRISTQRSKLGTVRDSENVWWSFAPHDISVILNLLGSPSIKSVAAHGAKVYQDEIEDDVHAEICFDGGATAHIQSSWMWPDNTRRCTIMCEKGMLIYDEVAMTVTVYKSNIDAALKHHFDNDPQLIELPRAQPLELECQHFLDCISGSFTPMTDGHNGLAVVEVLEQVQNILDEQ